MSKLGPLHITKHTGNKHSATVIFFHGSGGNGADMKEWVRLMVKHFAFPHINVLYPTAPLQPYTPYAGQSSNVWFDRNDISPFVPENLESISKIEVLVKNLIKEEHVAGIQSNRIIVGGFSMGGALALHTAYRWDHNLAGAFAFSSFLNDKSVVYEELKKSVQTQYPPLLQIHGDNDELVSHRWGQNTFEELKARGVKGELHIIEKLGHSVNKSGLTLIKQWVEKLLPEN